MVGGFFVEGRRQTLLYFCKCQEIKKITKICEETLTSRLLPETGDNKATNLETPNKQNGSKSTNHKSQTITF